MNFEMVRKLASEIVDGRAAPDDLQKSVKELCAFFVECVDGWETQVADYRRRVAIDQAVRLNPPDLIIAAAEPQPFLYACPICRTTSPTPSRCYGLCERDHGTPRVPLYFDAPKDRT